MFLKPSHHSLKYGLKGLTVLAFSVLFVTACQSTPSTSTPDSTKSKGENKTTIDPSYKNIHQAWQSAKQKWQKTNATNHYIYTLQRSCFCPPEFRKPMRIRVDKNNIKLVLLVPENTEKSTNFAGAKTVDGLFTLIEQAMQRKAASIEVSYDARFGYPTNIAIDYDKRMADEEVYYKASGMRLLPKP
ncbi:MAG: DUF6174 domain-containing protein [bacterium]